MLESSDYQPERDHDSFITRSIMKLLSLLSSIRDTGATKTRGAGAAMKLIAVLAFIILAAISRNMFFTYCLIAGFLVRLLFVPAKEASRVLRNAGGITLLSMLILLPSVFLGSPHAMLTVSIKIFLSVGLITLMSVTTPWNQLTQALTLFHVPDLLIFILDLTLKYIAILGEICCDMLTALRLRSVGRNHRKGRSLAGIPGVAFLKSRQMADEMYEAMVCRGFEGTYLKKRRRPFSKRDLPLLLALAAVVVLFIYLQNAL